MSRIRDLAKILTASTDMATDAEVAASYAPLSNPTFTAIGGSEGGQINLAAAPSNTTLSGNINLDVYQNRVRLFEGGGNNRGAYVDLTTLSNGVGSELLASSPQSGNTGKYLVTNGTTATWQENVVAGKNFLINGLFDIWQRSTDVTNSLSMGTFYAAADRWQNWVGTSCNTRYQRISNADPGVSQYSYRIQRVAGVTTATNYQLSQNIETSVAKLLVGKTVTLSFRVKKGANWSDADGTMSARVAYNDNTDGNVITQAASTAFSNTFTPTTSFATYSVTGTIPSSGVSTIMVNFFWEPTGTAGADDWLEFSAVQLEVGSVVTPFSRAGGSIGNELALCQRYYEQSFSAGTAPSQGAFATVNGVASAYSASDMRTQRFDFKVTKRVVPTMTYYRSNDTATDSRWVYYVNGWTTPTGTSNGLVTPDSFNVYMTSSSAFTTRDCYIIEGGGWTASAEL